MEAFAAGTVIVQHSQSKGRLDRLAIGREEGIPGGGHAGDARRPDALIDHVLGEDKQRRRETIEVRNPAAPQGVDDALGVEIVGVERQIGTAEEHVLKLLSSTPDAG